MSSSFIDFFLTLSSEFFKTTRFSCFFNKRIRLHCERENNAFSCDYQNKHMLALYAWAFRLTKSNHLHLSFDFTIALKVFWSVGEGIFFRCSISNFFFQQFLFPKNKERKKYVKLWLSKKYILGITNSYFNHMFAIFICVFTTKKNAFDILWFFNNWNKKYFRDFFSFWA